MPLSTQSRGVQLALTLQLPQPPQSGPAPGHRPCPICAGPTARHGRRLACVLCGYGTVERPRRRIRQRPRRPRPPAAAALYDERR